MSNYCHNCGHYPNSIDHVCTIAPRSTPLDLAQFVQPMFACHSCAEKDKQIATLTAQRDRLVEVLKVARQALIEMHHAHTNPRYFTDLEEGANRQFHMWSRKGAEAVAILAEIEREKP